MAQLIKHSTFKLPCQSAPSGVSCVNGASLEEYQSSHHCINNTDKHQLLRYGVHTSNNFLPPKQSFPRHIHRSDISAIQHTHLCSLCLNPLKAYPSLILDCGHIFHTDCVSCLEHNSNHKQQQKNEKKKLSQSEAANAACPLCSTDYPDETAEKHLIEGCRMFFILKSNVEYNGRPSKMWDKSAIEREQHEDEMVEEWRIAAHLGNSRAMENLAHIYNHGDCVEQNYEKAAYWYEKQAKKGNARSQFRLGRLYNNGQHFKQDYAAAAALYLKAAEQGYPKAQVAYAKLCLDGTGVKHNILEAEKWIEQAAELGNYEAKLLHADYLVDQEDFKGAFDIYVDEASKGVADAQYNLGVMCLNGQGVEVDHDKAALYFLSAADQNHKDACNCLGHMYEQGLGSCEVSNDEALRWFDKAAAQGCIKSQLAAASLHHKIKTSGTKKETHDQIAERLVRDAANHNDAKAQYQLGSMLQNRDKAQDPQEAIEWYIKSADNGDVDAMMKLGDMFYEGQGVDVCYKTAARWYKVAANLNCDEAQLNLGYMFYNGLGVSSKSPEEAERWYLIAAENHNAQAQYYLAKMYLRGIGGIEKCFNRAVYWLKKAADQGGHAGAQFYLARLYANGQAVKLSVDDAIFWAQKAADQGNDGAKDLLAVLLNEEEDDDDDDKTTKTKRNSKAASEKDPLRSSLEIPSETAYVLGRRKTLL